jgi:prepilin-type N-terminal cleavage/methylation domain-containing protein
MLMFSRSGGFTILEVMITMAVSASMLVIAVSLFGGQQRQTEFNQSIRDLTSVIEDSINDTATGYFPASNTPCASTLTTAPDTSGADSVAGQGTNKQCVFLGKALVFKESSFDVYPIVGSYLASTAPGAKFGTSLPTIFPSLVEKHDYLWGLKLKDIYWGDTTPHIGTGNLIVIASNPDGAGTDPSGYASGAQKINIYSSGLTINTDIRDGSSTDEINTAMRKFVSTSWVASATPSSNGVTLCVQDASASDVRRQYGGIIITGGINGVFVRQQISGDTPRCT